MKAKRLSDGTIIEVESIDACLVKDSIPFALYYIDKEKTIYCEDEIDLIFPLPETEEEVTIEGFAARDEDGHLFMYRTKPERNESLQMWMGEYANFDLRDKLFPNLTWEDEPTECKVTVTIKPKKK